MTEFLSLVMALNNLVWFLFGMVVGTLYGKAIANINFFERFIGKRGK